MKKKLWLDDIRKPPDDTWDWALNYEQCLQKLHDNVYEFVSLDHDLGKKHYMGDISEKTGYHVLCWMEEHNILPVHGIRVHSMNPVGKERMNKVIMKMYGRLFYRVPLNEYWS